jgi:hypothetical protein
MRMRNIFAAGALLAAGVLIGWLLPWRGPSAAPAGGPPASQPAPPQPPADTEDRYVTVYGRASALRFVLFSSGFSGRRLPFAPAQTTESPENTGFEVRSPCRLRRPHPLLRAR